ncbi:protein LKAAEAR1 isoform X2 [Phascolarctos cinereus]|nr:protein LKAAEAR1 isoform X2 [Phascolarctos cinereus]
MPEAQPHPGKMNKVRKSSSIKESEIGKPEQETSAEKKVAAGNESKQMKKASKATKEWKKIMAAKAAAKTIAAVTREQRSKHQSQWGEPTAQKMATFLKKYPDDLMRKDLTFLSPAEAKRYLLFVEPKRAGSTEVLSSDSIDSISSSQGCRQWELPEKPETEQQNRLIGVLKASEARSRVRALRLRYTRMRAEEIKHLISRQKTARAAIRLELFLPPHLNPMKIPDCLDGRERRRVEAILQEDNIHPLFR